MTAKHLSHLIADEHVADLRRAAEREHGAPRRRRRRAPLATALAALLALTLLATSAPAAGRVWIDAPIADLDVVAGQGAAPVFTFHTDTDTVL